MIIIAILLQVIVPIIISILRQSGGKGEQEEISRYGFAVARIGRDEYRYTEAGGYTMTFVADMLTGEINILIYPTSIDKWQPPHDAEPVIEATRNRILENVCAYFDRNHARYQIQR